MLTVNAIHEDVPFEKQVRRDVDDEVQALASWLQTRGASLRRGDRRCTRYPRSSARSVWIVSASSGRLSSR